MLADFLTKPLQGQLFKSFRDVILGYRHVDTLNSLVVPTPAQERVGFLRTGDDKTATTRNLGLEFQTEPRAVTWAEIVKGTGAVAGVKRREPQLEQRSMVVLRSLSRNNPASKNET